VLAVVALVGARLTNRSIAAPLRAGPSRATAGGTAAAVVGMAGLSLASGTASELLGLRGEGAMEQIARALSEPGFARLLLAIGAIAVAPGIAEETFFRGLVQTRLVARWGRWPGIAIASACFGIIHLDRVQGSLAFLAGLFLGWVAERLDGIRPSVAAHATNNAIFVALAPWATARTGSRAADITMMTAGCIANVAAIAFLRSHRAVRERSEH
jgi:membrane protease YdiL (CAAX protease family)